MLIGSLNWAVTLGRFDVHYAVSTMGRYQIAPREGHLEDALRIFGYLKHHIKRRISFDADLPEIPLGDEVEHNWENFILMQQKRSLMTRPSPRVSLWS